MSIVPGVTGSGGWKNHMEGKQSEGKNFSKRETAGPESEKCENTPDMSLSPD